MELFFNGILAMDIDDKIRAEIIKRAKTPKLADARAKSYDAGKSRAQRHAKFTGDKSKASKEDIRQQVSMERSQFVHQDRKYLIREVSGWLGDPELVSKHRDQGAQKAVAGGTGLDADHFGANQFGFPGGKGNLSRGNLSINRGAYLHKVEMRMQQMLKSGSAVYAVFTRVFRYDKATYGSKKHLGTSVTCYEVTKEGVVREHNMPLVSNPGHTKERAAAARAGNHPPASNPAQTPGTVVNIGSKLKSPAAATDASKLAVRQYLSKTSSTGGTSKAGQGGKNVNYTTQLTREQLMAAVRADLKSAGLTPQSGPEGMKSRIIAAKPSTSSPTKPSRAPGGGGILGE